MAITPDRELMRPLTVADTSTHGQTALLRSYVNVAATSGRSLGAPLGGLLADCVGWRW